LVLIVLTLRVLPVEKANSSCAESYRLPSENQKRTTNFYHLNMEHQLTPTEKKNKTKDDTSIYQAKSYREAT
jgi:hypothetical protein